MTIHSTDPRPTFVTRGPGLLHRLACVGAMMAFPAAALIVAAASIALFRAV